MKPIVVVGETNVDVVLRGGLPAPGCEVLAHDCLLTLGSASAICAAALARLGNPVSFVSRAGTDIWGDYCVGVLATAGIDTSHVSREAGVKTGITISIAESQDRALITYPGSIDSVTEDDVPEPLLAAAGHLHVSSYFLQTHLRPSCGRLFARARACGVSTSLDPGYDPRQDWNGGLRDVLRMTDLFLPNEVELLAVTGCRDPVSALLALRDIGTRTVVKLGGAGSMTLHDGRVVRATAFETEVVDTTGAGDSFNAGFLHAFLRQRSILECLLTGNACGALSTRALGGTAAQPTAQEIAGMVSAALGR